MTSSDSPSALEEANFDFAALCRLMWNYKLIIALATTVCGLVALYLALTTTPTFRAEITVAEVSNRNMGMAASLANQLGGLASLAGVNIGGLGGGTNREAVSLLNSRRLADEFIRRYDLLPTMYHNAQSPPTLWFAVRKFRTGIISIREDKRTNLTVVAINWTDPVVAAQWANAYIALANELMRDRAITESKANIAYLTEQISHTNVVELQRVMYNLIESETKTLMLANAKKEYGLAVVDPAVAPEIRYSPHRSVMVLVGLVVGMFIGVFIAYAHKTWVPNWRRAR